MLNYAICEIGGKQYKLLPNQAVEVPLQEGEKVEAKVLLLSDAGKLKIGNPYLKEDISLKIVDNVAGKKIRVSKFHAKANFRRTTGFRVKLTKLVWTVKS